MQLYTWWYRRSDREKVGFKMMYGGIAGNLMLLMFILHNKDWLDQFGFLIGIIATPLGVIMFTGTLILDAVHDDRT